MAANLPCSADASSVLAVRLTDAHRDEAIRFLSARPQHTVYLLGLIYDNGLESPLNRGTFYGCRNHSGELEGVALIGHATLVETTSDVALEAFTRLAQDDRTAHLIVGEQERLEQFWHLYSTGGSAPRRICRMMLYEQRWPVVVMKKLPGLRPAALEDLSLVMPIHAQLALEESGVNPLDVDPEAFRRRCARRIEQGRVWIVVEDGKLVFKADVIADTPYAAHLEGIYVAPEARGADVALRCLSQLSCELLERTASIVLLANEMKGEAIKLYQRAGFKLRGMYDTVFLQRPL